MRKTTITIALFWLLLGTSSPAKDTPDVAASPEEIHPLLIGASAPPLTLRSGDGKPFDLNTALGEKPTILILYRGGW